MVAADSRTGEGTAHPWAFFRCEDHGFAVPLASVAEIVPPQPATRLPGCGREVYGLVGLRGRVITVFDLGVLAGGRPATNLPDHRLVLVARGRRLVGLAVETMVTIAAPARQGSARPVLPGALQPGDVSGTVVMEGAPFLHLDVDHLLGRLIA